MLRFVRKSILQIKLIGEILRIQNLSMYGLRSNNEGIQRRLISSHIITVSFGRAVI